MYKLITYPKCELKFNYYVTNTGKVWSQISHKEMIPIIDKDGYLRVRLTLNSGKRRNFPVHCLVLMMFAPVINMMSLQVNHIDGNKFNNNIDNLEWCTSQENISHAVKLGLRYDKGEQNNSHKLSNSDVLKIREMCSNHEDTQRNISKLYGVHEDTIYKISSGKSWKHLNMV